MLSLLVLPKVITLSGFYCIIKTNFFTDPCSHGCAWSWSKLARPHRRLWPHLDNAVCRTCLQPFSLHPGPDDILQLEDTQGQYLHTPISL